MQIGFITIQVNDLDDSIKFYEQIMGLKVLRRFQAGATKEIAFLTDGRIKIELLYTAGEVWNAYGSFPSIGFPVENLDVALEECKAKGVTIAGGPFHPVPTARFFYINDPNGLSIQIIEEKHS